MYSLLCFLGLGLSQFLCLVAVLGDLRKSPLECVRHVVAVLVQTRSVTHSVRYHGAAGLYEIDLSID